MRILDLDNCISDDEWRISRIGISLLGSARFHAYHQLAPWDSFKNRELLYGEPDITILTGRPVMYRAATEEWLKRHNIRWRYLIMRNNNDERPSVEVKRMQMSWLLMYYDVKVEDISMAYDDRPEIVQMYRDAFMIPAEVRAIHSTPYPRAA